ncbi:hypothetical protein NY057_05175 [Curtobacterium flaccumfaciens]|nr:hypothetical protein [Curtobacterium flaccumfaciens]UWD83638.1 hypothetical protein NY057_05175 [Curtobacterium flaccumfaciens]
MTGLFPLVRFVVVWLLAVLNRTTVAEIRRRPTRGERRGKERP